MKILVLAGGSDQIALIAELKNRGHYVYLVDYFQNPPAREIADCHIIASTLDIDKIKEIAIVKKVNLICTACTDQALLTIAKVSEELSLPCYISHQTALNVTNKIHMKRIMQKHHIPTSKYYVIDNIDNCRIDDFCFPLVVKPVDCNSSKGVKRVDNMNDLKTALSQALSLSKSKKAIVEEFKSGEEISADFYIEENDVKFLCATKSVKIENTNGFTISQSLYPVTTLEQEKQLLKIARQIANAFQLRNTPLLVQLIMSDNHFFVIEFSARMGGGSKYKLIEVLSGVNIMSKYVDLILGEAPLVFPSKQIESAAMNYIYCKPGIFSRAIGLSELKKAGYITEYFLYKTAGMEIAKSETSGDRVAGYLVTASNKDELKSKINHIDSQLIVCNDCSMDIMLHNLF